MLQTLRDAKENYANEWIAFIVKKEKSEIDQLEGEVIEHDKDRRELHRRLRERNIENAYVTFAGPLIRPGYSVMF